MFKVNVLNQQFFAEVVVRDEVSILRSIHRAIPKWEEVALSCTFRDFLIVRHRRSLLGVNALAR
jgi:hypothetical protein